MERVKLDKKEKKKNLLGFFNSFSDTYVPPPLDFKSSTSIWNVDELITKRVRDWRKLLGEDGKTGSRAGVMREEETVYSGTYSVFPAPLVEWIYLRYAGVPHKRIYDPFAGGPPRAVVAAVMGYEYHGMDIRQEAIDENYEILKKLNLNAIYHNGDSSKELLVEQTKFDFSIACPPYYNLEQYSDDPADLSNLPTYKHFNKAMRRVAVNTYKLMKGGAFVCLIVGNFRDKKSKELVDFRGDTVRNYMKAGFTFWQDIVLARSAGSAAVRAATSWKGMKLVPRHEYLLVFRRP